MDEPKKIIKYSASQPLSSLNYTDIAEAVSKLKLKVIAFANFCRINFILPGAGLDSNIEVYHNDDCYGDEPEIGVMFSAEYENINYDKELAEYNLLEREERT